MTAGLHEQYTVLSTTTNTESHNFVNMHGKWEIVQTIIAASAKNDSYNNLIFSISSFL